MEIEVYESSLRIATVLLNQHSLVFAVCNVNSYQQCGPGGCGDCAEGLESSPSPCWSAGEPKEEKNLVRSAISNIFLLYLQHIWAGKETYQDMPDVRTLTLRKKWGPILDSKQQWALGSEGNTLEPSQYKSTAQYQQFQPKKVAEKFLLILFSKILVVYNVR